MAQTHSLSPGMIHEPRNRLRKVGRAHGIVELGSEFENRFAW